MIFKFIKVLAEWLFAPRFYYMHKGFTRGTKYELAQLMVEHKLGKKLRQLKCKQCGIQFWAFRKNDTCPSIVCFFKYKLKGD